MLENTLESPLDCKEIQPVHHKGDQSWVFIWRTDAEDETPVLGHLMRRVDSLEKTLMLGGIGGRRKKGLQRMRWLDGITDLMHMSLGGLVSCDSWGRKELDMTEQLNWLADWYLLLIIYQFSSVHPDSCIGWQYTALTYSFLLLFPWSTRCWQFDLWFFCLV